jgi:hypothetical protein
MRLLIYVDLPMAWPRHSPRAERPRGNVLNAVRGRWRLATLPCGSANAQSPEFILTQGGGLPFGVVGGKRRQSQKVLPSYHIVR